MSKSVCFYAQPFWEGGRQGQPLPFACAVDAEEGARILTVGGAAGAVVYALWGDDEAEIYDDPEILQVIGEVPRAALCIDPDGRDPWLDDSSAEAA